MQTQISVRGRINTSDITKNIFDQMMEKLGNVRPVQDRQKIFVIVNVLINKKEKNGSLKCVETTVNNTDDFKKHIKRFAAAINAKTEKFGSDYSPCVMGIIFQYTENNIFDTANKSYEYKNLHVMQTIYDDICTSLCFNYLWRCIMNKDDMCVFKKKHVPDEDEYCPPSGSDDEPKEEYDSDYNSDEDKNIHGDGKRSIGSKKSKRRVRLGSE